MDTHIDRSLMIEIEGRIARISQTQHELARQKQKLIEARVQLRISGRLPYAVVASLEEQPAAG